MNQPHKEFDPTKTDSAASALLHHSVGKVKLSIHKDGQVVESKSMLTEEAARRLDAALATVSSKEQRRALRDIKRQLAEQSDAAKIHEMIRRVKAYPRDEVDKVDPTLWQDVQKVEDTVEAFELGAKVAADLRGWGAAPTGLQLERAQASRAHSLLAASNAGSIILMEVDADRIIAMRQMADISIGQVFVVEHDWAAAFDKAGDYHSTSEFRLPYDMVCFEFRLSGRHVIVLAKQSQPRPEISVVVELKTVEKNGWLLVGGGSVPEYGTIPKIEGLWEPIYLEVSRQIKAICVALGAKVAETEIIRAPYRLNARREREGRLPIFDHHVVRLNRRARPRPLPPSDGERTPGRRRRFHFRRGHWRHFETHQTWIEWMLVGDPDLGWIEKEYRL